MIALFNYLQPSMSSIMEDRRDGAFGAVAAGLKNDRLSDSAGRLWSGVGEGGSPDSGVPMAEVDYVAHVIVMPIVLTIGMVNQCLNVCTLLQLPTDGFLYLKASAIADILSIISFIPFLLRHAGLIDTTSRPAMFYHAHIELPLINALIASSALCILAMTVDRYLSVCHPIKFRSSNESTKRTLAVIGALYLTAFIVYLPSTWQKKLSIRFKADQSLYRYEIIRNHQVEDLLGFQMYLLFRELVSRWGPVVLLVVLNAAMVRSLHKLQKKQRSLKKRKNGRTVRDERARISALLWITSTTFVLCNLPASFLSLFIRKVDQNSFFWQIFRASSNLLQVTSYLYNFYLYALCSSEYRQAFLSLVGCGTSSTPSGTGDSPTVRLSSAHQAKKPLICHELNGNQLRLQLKDTETVI